MGGKEAADSTADVNHFFQRHSILAWLRKGLEEEVEGEKKLSLLVFWWWICVQDAQREMVKSVISMNG